jgi:hypothetical protein
LLPAAKRLAGAFGELVFDTTTSRLTYKLDVDAMRRDGVTAVWIHRASEGKPAAALHQLFGGAATAPAGGLTFSYLDRRDLAAGQLVLRVYSRRAPSGGEAVKLAFPPT